MDKILILHTFEMNTSKKFRLQKYTEMPTPDKSIGEFIKPPKIKKLGKKNKNKSANEIDVINESSSDSSGHATISYGHIPQEHARPRIRLPTVSVSQMSALDLPNRSSDSLSSSITRFRNDFDQLKCKMRIFGETLNLCRCLADDFKNKLVNMERRLENLEKRQKLTRTASNYSAIIQKNKLLSYKTLKDAKKLQMCGTEEEMREVAARICRNYLHGSWKTVDPKVLDFRKINGGLSNFLYYVALPDDVTKLGGYQQRENSPEAEDASKLSVINRTGSVTYCALEEPKKVLLRIYGQVHGERAMDAIVTESVVFTLLSERRLGPKLHGVFSGGRIEEFIPARPLLAAELADPALSMKIAEKMAAIHSMDVPLNKEPNYIWKTMGKWLKTVKEERLAGTQGKNEEEQRIIKILKAIDFDKEMEWLKKFLATVESPVCFCHNDMQEGNILLLEDSAQAAADEDLSALYIQSYDSDLEKKDYEISQFEDANTSDTIISRVSDIGEPKLVFIDFEYCAYNYRGFDIANHFQEWAYDYTNPEHPFYYENQDYSPNLEQKEIFIKQYLKHYSSSQDERKAEASLDDVNKLLDEVEAFACASHLFWTLWSIVNASKSQIPFGYWEYAISRLETYQRLKQEAIKKSQNLPQKRKICEVDI